MRICVVCHEASPMGAPRIGFDIAAFLAERHEITLLAKMGGALVDCPRYASLRGSYRCVGTSQHSSGLTYAQRVDAAVVDLRELSPDVLYVNSVMSGEWCEAGARVGIPVALHTHETRHRLPAILSGVCTPSVLRWVDLLVGASRTAICDVEEITDTSVRNRFEFGIVADVESVLSLSAREVPPPRNSQDDPLGRASGTRPIVGMYGLPEAEGSDIFVETATRSPDYDFLWIGSWGSPERRDTGVALEQFKSRGLRNLYLTGPVDNPYPYMDMLDTFVLTSGVDPNPLVLAEALLLGKKTLAFSGTGASLELLARFGYAFHGNVDAARVAEVLPVVLQDRTGWQSDLSERVRREVDGKQKLKQLEALLEGLVSHGGVARAVS